MIDIFKLFLSSLKFFEKHLEYSCKMSFPFPKLFLKGKKTKSYTCYIKKSQLNFKLRKKKTFVRRDIVDFTQNSLFIHLDPTTQNKNYGYVIVRFFN